MVRALAIVNTAGPTKGQAVALHVQSNLAAFFRLNIIAYQDTLYAHSLHHFYRDCHIYGTVDFIFGNAAEVFQNCHFFACRPMPKQKNMITADGRFEPTQETGFIFQNCTIQASPDLEAVKGNFSTYLGRPWRSQARGRHKGKDEVGGLKVDGEVKKEVWKFTVAEFIQGQLWLKAAGVPFKARL
ncbi:hypothetical protein AMTR_s00147p00102150 [Amborella trichopoda]|uniref:Pectinesterase n=1 Tax=Amborella trichopoda TaxID=13333 RepID=W1P3F5_AMBTC|nr:hypothetical protein AMTR_s00147p00102150 [Amborella trichopoda]